MQCLLLSRFHLVLKLKLKLSTQYSRVCKTAFECDEQERLLKNEARNPTRLCCCFYWVIAIEEDGSRRTGVPKPIDDDAHAANKQDTLVGRRSGTFAG